MQQRWRGWAWVCFFSLWVLLPGPVAAATCHLAWDPVTECVEGGECLPVGYRLYAKTKNEGYATTPTVEILVADLADANAPAITAACTKGQRWVATAYDDETESHYSNEVVVRLRIVAPTNLTTKVFPGGK